jgi:hypothetical protein
MFLLAWVWFSLGGLTACGGNVFDCDEGMHRSGDDCVEDRVLGQPDTGSGESDTGE